MHGTTLEFKLVLAPFLGDQEVHLDSAIRECVEMVKVDCELRSIRLDLDLAANLPAVVADEIQIQQVLLNLLRNALDAMETPGPQGDRVLRIETALTAVEEISVRVADRGVGIADGNRACLASALPSASGIRTGPSQNYGR